MEIFNLFWGFILTIWNVNEAEQAGADFVGAGFILTIWNVNLPKRFLAILYNVVLY
ncbi:TPA: hypothetical protein I9640_001466 [Clostridioides difficile]|nr:hypothetical protein [Clostridioides difficile]